MATTSDDAVVAATGRDLESWFTWLHDHEAEELDHRQIVRLLSTDAEVLSGWWCQQLTTQFELHIGRQLPGQTEDGMFALDVQRSFRSSPARAWLLLASEAGAAAWLGEAPDPWWHGSGDGPDVGDELRGLSGESFLVRGFEAEERIELRAYGPALPESVIQLRLIADRGRTTIELRQEQIMLEEQHVAMVEHWNRALDRIAALLDEE